MYYPSSENKGTDQLRGYREADLRLYFRLCRLLVFPWGGSNMHTCFVLSLEVTCELRVTDVVNIAHILPLNVFTAYKESKTLYFTYIQVRSLINIPLRYSQIN